MASVLVALLLLATSAEAAQRLRTNPLAELENEMFPEDHLEERDEASETAPEALRRQLRQAVNMTKECECKSWAQVYAQGMHGQGVRCGQAFELRSGSVAKLQVMKVTDSTFKELHQASGDKECTNFLERLDANYCIKVDRTVQSRNAADNHWCYTSPKCTTGTAVSNVAWKKCDAPADKFLGEVSAPELLKLAKANDVHPTQLIELAYNPVNADPAKMNLGELSELGGGWEAQQRGRNVGLVVKDEAQPMSARAIVSAGSVYRYTHREMGTKPREFLVKHAAGSGLLECVGGCPTGTLIRSFKTGIN